MDWFSGVLVYVMIWWVVFFTTLPFGARPPAKLEPGHDAGAPEKPMLWRKALITTAIATVLFGLAFTLIDSDLISFRQEI